MPLTQSEILFDCYEYRTGIFLPKAYVVGRNQAGRLVHVHHSAKIDGLGLYSIELTDDLRRALQLVQQLRPPAIAEVFRGGARKSPTLPGLISAKSKERDRVVRHIHHRTSEVLALCKRNRWAVTINLNVRGEPDAYTVSFPARDPAPHVSVDISEKRLTYQLRLREEGGSPTLIRYGEWKVITNHPTPGWLLRGRQLIRFGHLNGNHIKPFLSRDAVHVEPAEVPTFWRKFVVKMAERHTLHATGFDYGELTAPDRLRVAVRLHPFEHRYLIYPEFVYGDKSFAIGETKQFAVSFTTQPPYRLRRLIRDAGQEAALLGRLNEFGLSPISGSPALVVRDGGRFGALRWALERQATLRDLGMEVELPAHQGRPFSAEAGDIQLEFAEIDDWLDLRATVKVGHLSIPFAKLVRYIQKDERCYPLPDGSIFLIPEAWFTKYKPSLQFAKTEGKKVRLARSQAPLLAPLGLEVPLGDVDALVEQFTPSKALRATLRPYQLAGVKWLIRHHHQQLGACLADDMGLGKTLQTIAVLQYAKEQLGAAAGAESGRGAEAAGAVATQMDLFAPPAEDETFLQPLRALIILPASLIYNWRAELDRFTPGLTTQLHTGPKRNKDARLLRRFDVLLTTYQTALRDKDILREIEFSYIVLDESQQIKNRGSKIFRALNELSATHRISLSGTPIENSLSDLWSQMQFINPGLLRGYAFFKKEFIEPIELHDDEARKTQLRGLVTPHLLRRTKAEVAPDLPDLEVQVYHCEMTPTQRKIYEREKSAARNALLGNYAPEDGQYRLRVIQTLTRLRQLANHPALLDDGYMGDSGKFTDVLDQWRTVRRSGQKVLIFSSMVSHLEIFRDELIRENEDFAWITGSVSSEDRAKAVARFQNDPKLSTFFISIKAGGTGLNLTAADYVFILDPWWNPSIEDQAIARAHRIGRVGNVFARKFISRGTIEEKINRLQQRKKKLADDILGSGDHKMVFAKGEISFLLE